MLSAEYKVKPYNFPVLRMYLSSQSSHKHLHFLAEGTTLTIQPVGFQWGLRPKSLFSTRKLA